MPLPVSIFNTFPCKCKAKDLSGMSLASFAPNVLCRTELKQGGREDVIDDIWYGGQREIYRDARCRRESRGAAIVHNQTKPFA